MFLTKECDYGIRIIRALTDGAKKTVETIAKEQHIPLKYSYKIIKKLDQAGFLQSVRGRSGGYRLHKPLDSFTLADIVMTIDPARYINECLHESSDCPFKSDPDTPCTVHLEFTRIHEMIVNEFKALTMDAVLRVETED